MTEAEARQCWETPPALFAALDAEFGPFTLDVAASAHNAKCAAFYDGERNGLVQPWPGRVWCNPPYKDIGPWVRRAIEAIRHEAELVVLLVPDTREVAWWREAKAAGAFDRPFPRRIAFLPPPGDVVKASNNRFGNALLVFGCPVCHGPIPRGTRGPPRVTCSDRCRKALRRKTPDRLSAVSQPPQEAP